MKGTRVAGILAVAVLALAFAGCGGDSGSSDADVAPTTEAAEPTPAESGDTGRMSQGEWESARATIFDVNGELLDYTEKLGGRCAALFSGGDVTAGLECADDAYDGVEGSLGLAVSDLEGLQEDTGERCRKSLVIAANIANQPLYQAARVSKASFDTLEAGVVTLALKRLNAQRERWSNASGNVLQLCAPE